MTKIKMSLKNSFLVVMLFLCASAYGQQEKLLTHFMYDRMSFNPGSTGTDVGYSATMLYRNQWDRFVGAPNSYILNLEGNFNNIGLGGMGLSIYHDAIGFLRQNNFVFNYSHPFQIRELWMLNIGLGVGLVNFSNNSADWIPPTTLDDPMLQKIGSSTNLDLNLGLFWKSFKGYYFGISSTHLNQSELNKPSFTNKRHYFFTGGNRFTNVFGPGRDIESQLLMRSDLIKVSGDINLRYFHENLFYSGLAFRPFESVGFLVGLYPFKNATVGYSYDLNIFGLNSVSNGSHELLFRYKYVIPEPPLEKTKHPRWL
jgi:type IX secretion system PorP/SprF family membrane protein